MLPGGKQEKDETPAQTAIRETFEETGIKTVNRGSLTYHKFDEKLNIIESI